MLDIRTVAEVRLIQISSLTASVTFTEGKIRGSSEMTFQNNGNRP